MHGVGVRRGMNGDGLDPYFAASAMDAQRDLAPVCDEHFVKQFGLLENQKRFAEFNRLAIVD